LLLELQYYRYLPISMLILRLSSLLALKSHQPNCVNSTGPKFAFIERSSEAEKVESHADGVEVGFVGFETGVEGEALGDV